MKIFSWNVNGIRAVHKKGLFLAFLEAHKLPHDDRPPPRCRASVRRESELLGEVAGKSHFGMMFAGSAWKKLQFRVSLFFRRVPVLAVKSANSISICRLGLSPAGTECRGVSLEKCEEQALLMHGTMPFTFHKKSSLAGLARQPAPKALYTAISDVAASVRLCESSNSALRAVRSASSTSRKSMRPPSKRFWARSAALSLAAAAICNASRRVL